MRELPRDPDAQRHRTVVLLRSWDMEPAEALLRIISHRLCREALVSRNGDPPPPPVWVWLQGSRVATLKISLE